MEHAEPSAEEVLSWVEGEPAAAAQYYVNDLHAIQEARATHGLRARFLPGFSEHLVRAEEVSRRHLPALAERWSRGGMERIALHGLLLDLLSYGTEVTHGALKDAGALEQPKLAYFAAQGMLNLGMDVPAPTLERLFADPEAAWWTWKTLAERGRLDLVPQASFTEEALARACLVRSLVTIHEVAVMMNPDAARDLEEPPLLGWAREDGREECWYLFSIGNDAEGKRPAVVGPLKGVTDDACWPNAYTAVGSFSPDWPERPILLAMQAHDETMSEGGAVMVPYEDPPRRALALELMER